jgi:DNA-3-methyladenine glycosylase
VTGRPLPAAFYSRDTEVVARELLGAVLECTARGARCRGRIVEAEAYTGEEDLACHAAAGRTARTELLYGPPGRAYVYFIYGMHWCVNAVTRRAGLPSAVLIRAVEPIEGIEVMRRRRRGRPDRELTNGPGKLCEAFGISGPRHHGASLVTSPLKVREGDWIPDQDVEVTPRIGITRAAERPLRWIVRSSAPTAGRPAVTTFRSNSRSCTGGPRPRSW